MQSPTHPHPRHSKDLNTNDSHLIKSTHSRLYDSINFDRNSLIHTNNYDSTYKLNGFPKLYSYQNPSQEGTLRKDSLPQTNSKYRMSVDHKTKYSFRNDYSKIVEDNSALLKQNAFLRQELNRLNILLDTERRNSSSRVELDRLNSILIQKDTEIRTLNQRIFTLQSRTSQSSHSNEWQLKYNESQLIINQLNIRVTQLTQQITNYQTQINQLTFQINQQVNAGAIQQQYEGQINQLNVRITQLTQQLSSYELQITQLKQQSQTSQVSVNYQNQINQLRLQLQNYEQQISQLRQQQNNQVSVHYETQITQLNQQIQAYELQITQLRQQLQGDSSSSSQYESHINQLNVTINQYKQQISQLNVQINEYRAQIVNLEQKSSRESRGGSSSRNDAQLNDLRNQLNELSYKLEQYKIHISSYQSEITSLQQVNWKLQERITRESNAQAPVAQVNQQWRIEQGKLSLKVIILLEEINRLKQKEQELTIKSEQLHAYLLKAENYIEEIQFQLERNNLKENIPTHIVQKITLLEQQNKKYYRLIQELQSRLSVTKINAIPEDEYYTRMGERDLRIIILLEEINRLNQKTVEIREYLVQAEDYIEQLQKAIQERETIIPPEVENQINYLSQENHRLNLLIENYIAEIKHLKVNVQVQAPIQTKIEYQIPAEVETRLAFLTAENERLNRQIVEVSNRPARVETRVETKIEYRVPDDVNLKINSLTQENTRLNNLVISLQNRPVQQIQPQTIINASTVDTSLIEQEYAKAKFRTIILLEEINRLNHALQEVTGYLVTAENFIFDLETRMANISQQTIIETKTITNTITNTVEVIPENLERELAKMALQRIFLMEEINRLNSVVKEIHDHLIHAEDYIQQCEARFNEIQQSSRSQTVASHSVEFRIPPEVEARILQLTQENQRLNRAILEIQNRPSRVQTRIEQKVEFRIPPEVDARILQLTQQNERLNRSILEIQNRAPRVQARVEQKVQYRIPPEIENRINLLASENQRIERELALQRAQPKQDDSLQFEYGKLQFRSIILLEEINRLNFVATQLRSFLENAENYIFEIENRQPQVGVSAEIEEEMVQLRRENQKLHAEINRISAFFEQQIVQYKSEISNINIQLSSFRSEASTYKSRVGELERSSASNSSQTISLKDHQQVQRRWAQEQFRVIILLQEINRLNKKCGDIDAQKMDVIGHLVKAQDYIQELQGRYSQLQQSSSKQSVITTVSTNVTISQLSSLRGQLSEMQKVHLIQLGRYGLRIIILLQEINRLNNKISLLSSQLQNSSNNNTGTQSNQQIAALRNENARCQGQLHQVLNHLRNAQDYIGELLRQSEGFVLERSQLINELNRLRR